MPIHDYNDSMHFYMKGMNMVWKDTMRHRADPLSRIGPHTVAAPYTANYLLPGNSMKCLTHLSAPQLQGPPVDDNSVIDAVMERRLSIPSNQYVLIHPIVDIVMSVSRISSHLDTVQFIRHGRLVFDFDWYESPLRLKWAHEAMRRAASCIQDRRYRDASEDVAKVFGTMLPGFIVGALSGDEEDIFRRSWSALQELVPPRDFLSRLYSEMRFDGEPSLEKMRVRQSMRPVSRLGHQELTMAEDIIKLEEEIVALERHIHNEGLPPGQNTFEVEVLPITSFGTIRFRLVGSVMTFDIKGKVEQQRMAAWVLDRHDKSKLKLIRFRPLWYAALKTNAENHGIDIDNTTEAPDIIIKGIPEATEGREVGRIRIVFGRKHRPLTPEEQTVVATGATRDRVEGHYNGRVGLMRRLSGLRKSHTALASKYEKACFDARSKEVGS